MAKNPKFSVILALHNRHEMVDEVFSSLRKLKGDYEVIVIDSSDSRLRKVPRGFVYIYDKDLKALSKKRNLGISRARGEIVAFTDDDCIVDSNWLLELEEGLRGGDACTGRTVAYDSSKEAFENRFSFDKRGAERKVIKKHFGFQNILRFGHGNNMAFWRGVFENLTYDERLGVGSEGLAGEDSDVFYRIYKSGRKIVYNPKALVYHKHLVNAEDVPKMAYRNGFAGRELLRRHKDLNYLVFYFVTVCFVILKVFFSLRGKKTHVYSLKGWLGMRM